MNPWTLLYEGFDAASEGLRESLCTLGNGYVATRGATPDGDLLRTPGTYVAGCYNRLTSSVAGREITNEELVNLPDWLPLTFATPGSDWFRPERADLVDYRQELDMRCGVLHRLVRWRDDQGRVTSVRQRRLVSMADQHLAALEAVITAENWSGPLRVRSTLDGTVTNRGVERYRAFRGDHLTGHAEGDGWLTVRTSASEVTIALAVRHDGDLVLDLEQGEPVSFTKTVALFTSRDPAIHDPLSAARRAVSLAPAFDELLDWHVAAWAKLWDRAGMEVDGPEVAQIVNLHIFHLLQTLSPHTADLDVGVPARGLHGEAYRGHVFWDELFVLPWLNLRFPEVARGLLRHRWRRLPEARAAARAAGHDGAMFPWQSGSDGREETQTLHLNPASGHWLPDHSHLQRHVGLAIAFNVWHHYHEGALDNNAYTNIMTVWLLMRAAEISTVPDEWDDITRRMRVDFHDGVISQFTGYADLPELDWARYRGIRRLDRALEADGDRVSRYRAAKQADVLMLFHLLPADELRAILNRLGYPAEPDLIPRTIRYYLDRTSHGSTLSAVVHASVLSGIDPARSWRFFVEALASDIKDVQDGTTAEGIHLGAMAGTLDLVQRNYLGLEIRRDGLHLDPTLPERLDRLSMPLTVRGARLFVDADHAELRVSRTDDGPGLVTISTPGAQVRLDPKETIMRSARVATTASVSA